MLSVPALAQSQSSAPIAYLWEAQGAVTFSEGTSLPGCVLVGEKSEETPPSLADFFFPSFSSQGPPQIKLNRSLGTVGRAMQFFYGSATRGRRQDREEAGVGGWVYLGQRIQDVKINATLHTGQRLRFCGG